MKIGLLFCLLFLATLTVAAPMGWLPYCRDLEGKRDAFTAGTIVTERGNFSDQCFSKTNLIEFFCLGMKKQSNLVRCSNGCKAGACIKPPTRECNTIVNSTHITSVCSNFTVIAPYSNNLNAVQSDVQRIVQRALITFKAVPSTLRLLPLGQKVTIMYVLNSGQPSAGDWVISLPTTEAALPHELDHVYLRNTPITHWFNEGHAVFVQQLIYSNYGAPLLSRDAAVTAETVYVNNLSEWSGPAANSSHYTVICTDAGHTTSLNIHDFRAYSNFSKEPDSNAAYDSPNVTGNYYGSGECFWAYVVKNYGLAGFRAINAKLYEARSQHRTARFIRDIVNPALGTDLLPFVREKFSYQDRYQ